MFKANRFLLVDIFLGYFLVVPVIVYMILLPYDLDFVEFFAAQIKYLNHVYNTHLVIPIPP